MLNVSFSAIRGIANVDRVNRRPMIPALLALAFASATIAQAAPLATTTTLALSATTVASPAEVMLTASVTGGAAPLNGSVEFCDASASLCQDTAILAKVPLSAGSAVFRLLPAIGSHSYKAVFLGSSTSAASTSPSQNLTVTGLYNTTTTVTASGNPTGYALTATVVGYATQPPVLAGTVTFQDTTNSNLLLGTAPLGTPVFAQTFIQAPGSPVQTGNAPAVTAVGDYNEDGKPDLAVANGAGDDTISILFGNGDGTFTPGTPIPAFGTSPCESFTAQSNCSIVVGDFDRDGHQDLALTSGDDFTVTVLKGNGHGGFTPFPGSPIAVGNYPEAVRIGDFNNDGIQDLAVANSDDNTVTILLGNGDGTFTPAPGLPTALPLFPFFLAVADFNRDGNADLAVGNGRDNSVSILLGNGDGTFHQAPGSPIAFPAGSGVCPVIAADFNEDGIVDLAVALFDNNAVEILIGNGDGTFVFSSQSPISVGTSPFSMTILDFNGDGHTDLAVANYGYAQPNGNLNLLIGDGHGNFSQPLPAIPLGNEPNDIVAGDFNADGHPDLAIPESGDTTTTILLNNPTQTATATLSNVILPGAGTHVVKATYPANTQFNTSFGTVDLVGLFVPTTLTLTDNPTAQLDTLSVTFTAQLSPSTILPPTGTISFFDGGVPLGTVNISANGQAVFTTNTLADGMHSITASYSGDTIYQASTSTGLPITISDLQVAQVGKYSPIILPGTTVSYNLQVAPLVASTFLYNVTLSASGLPAGAAATFSPATLSAGGGTATVTMTITTAATASNEQPASPFGRLPLALGLLLPLFGARAFRKRLRHIPPLLSALLLAALSLAAITGLSGCAGAGLFAARKVPYTINVIASEGTPAYGNLQRATGVPLAIQ